MHIVKQDAEGGLLQSFKKKSLNVARRFKKTLNWKNLLTDLTTSIRTVKFSEVMVVVKWLSFRRQRENRR